MAEPGGVGGFLWQAAGVFGAILFYGRFYVQWIVSEVKRKSVMPIAFWYMSGLGSIVLLAYAIYKRNPGASFGLAFNMVVYTRNLIHVWRERGVLSKRLNVIAHTVAAGAVLTGAGFTAWVWYLEWRSNAAAPAVEAARNWMWLGVWAVGQACFFLRFLAQWAVTEYKKRSTVPPLFWRLSVVAAVLQGAYFVSEREWIFLAGMAATLLIYLRNMWFIKRKGPTDAAGGTAT